MRRALHVFQLEGYKRRRFLQWARADRARALFVRAHPQKKPLVMTGRAWRLLITSAVLCLAGVLVLPGIMHIAWGFPLDLGSWAVMSALLFLGVPEVLVVADSVMSPIQRAINERYLRRAATTLQELSPTVVAITGSFGKTSTKFAIETLAGEPGTILATPSSYNTPLGVCRAINERLGPAHRVFVVEMGAYGEGEIAELMGFVRPSIGVLTAVGPAHLERFGSMDAIRRAKYEVVRDLPSGGTAVMSVDDQIVRALADDTTHVAVVRYGLDADGRPDVTARDVTFGSDGTTMTILDQRDGTQVRLSTPLLGSHAVGHVLAGFAVARAVGRTKEEIARAASRLRPVEHRLQLMDGAPGITIIDDAYNSNPDGAAAALAVLEAMPADRRIVVTPGMIELGELQYDENRRFGELAGGVADTLIVVARVNRDAIVEGAGGKRAKVITVDSLDEAQVHLRDFLRPGSVVLFENDLPDQYES
ncbi:MAG: UDP-N-acetylmuramoyl-tripeptide--D-alanyl-D-alanine ligase [Actinobacteria bacterium]|nr:UDP-N-acetylmuramoyl-tripeptide--D-alanyl-D-alanine ligase [Actinomycetota bacterium]